MDRLILAVVLFVIVALFGMNARAADGYGVAVSIFTMDGGFCHSVTHPESPAWGETPVKAFSELARMRASGDPCGGTFPGFHQIRRTSGSPSSATFQFGNAGSNVGGVGREGAGDPCWETAKSSMTATTWYNLDDPIFAACSICPAPEEWNAVTSQCEMPECDPGEVWDPSITACRAVCEENEVYVYESASCKLQCTPGKTAARGYLSNKRLDVHGEVFTVNGCPATAHVNCQPDTEGLILEKFGAQHVTGQFCKIHFVYNEEIEQTVEFQVVYEDELDGELGYQGEEAADPVLDGEFQEPAAKETITYNASLEQFDSSNWKYVCNNGTAAWVYELDGVAGQIEMAGACPLDNEEVDPAVASPQAIQPQLQGLAQTQEEQGDLLGEISAMIASIADGDINFDMNWGEWADPAEPEAYEQQHTEGLEGAIGEGDLSDTAVGEYLETIVPNFAAIEAPECFSWSIPTPVIGTVDFTPPCFVWDLIKTMMIFSAMIAAWAIVFVDE